jgi:hypothetical protein
MLSAYIDGELSPQDKQALEEHLSSCDSCREALLEFRAVKRALQSLPAAEPPAGLHAKIMAGLKPRRLGFLTKLSERLSHWTYRQWVPAAAAVMVLAVFLSAGTGVWYANRRQGLDLAGRPQLAAYDEAKGEGGAKSDTLKVAPPAGKGGDAGAGAQGTGGVSPAGTLEDVDRKIIRRAQVALEVVRGNVRRAADEAMNLIKASFGYVESSSIAQSDQTGREITSFYMVARVPQENLDKTIEAVSALGKPTRQDTSAQDITDQYVDLDARLRNKENEETRLLQIMGQAKSVGELLQVEGELTRVRGDIESMRAQIMRYDKSVAMSSLSLTISEEGAVKPPSPWPWHDVWQAFVNAWRTLLILVAKVAPAAIVAGVVIAAVALALRRKRPV